MQLALPPRLIPQLRRQLLDQPNARSSHRQPTPRGGGIAFVAVASVSSGDGIAQWSRVGLPLPFLCSQPHWRLLACSMTVTTCPHRGVTWRPAVHSRSHALLQPSRSRIRSCRCVRQLASSGCLVLLVIAVTAVINFTNFMDGLDGLVAGCMAVNIAALSIDLMRPGRCGPWWVLCLVSCSGTGAPPRCSWAMWAAPFLVLCSLAWCSRPPAGQRRLAASCWPLPCWEMLASVYPAVYWLDNGCSRPTVCICSSACTRPAGLTPAFPSLTSRPQLCWRWLMLVGGWPWVFGMAVFELLLGVWLDQRVAVPFAVASKS